MGRKKGSRGETTRGSRNAGMSNAAKCKCNASEPTHIHRLTTGQAVLQHIREREHADERCCCRCQRGQQKCNRTTLCFLAGLQVDTKMRKRTRNCAKKKNDAQPGRLRFTDPSGFSLLSFSFVTFRSQSVPFEQAGKPCAVLRKVLLLERYSSRVEDNLIVIGKQD